MQIFCDFDGTISIQDATDFVLNRLADSEWKNIEEEWKAGAIGSAECMRRQIDCIDAKQLQLDEVLDEIKIDSDFPDFVEFCHEQNIKLNIVSDGVDYFIDRILSRHGINDLPIIANHLLIWEDKYRLMSPYADSRCQSAAGTCKCQVVKNHSPSIYIGDGRSDFCVVSKEPDLIFAKGKLSDFCKQKDLPHVSFSAFSDIKRAMQSLIPYSATKLLNA